MASTGRQGMSTIVEQRRSVRDAAEAHCSGSALASIGRFPRRRPFSAACLFELCQKSSVLDLTLSRKSSQCRSMVCQLEALSNTAVQRQPTAHNNRAGLTRQRLGLPISHLRTMLQAHAFIVLLARAMLISRIFPYSSSPVILSTGPAQTALLWAFKLSPLTMK